jgi:hypothetical protein
MPGKSEESIGRALAMKKTGSYKRRDKIKERKRRGGRERERKGERGKR